MRKQAVPQGTMAGSSVKKRMIGPAKATESNPMPPRPTCCSGRPARRPARRRSGFFAPRFCPTSVAAALLRPRRGEREDDHAQPDRVARQHVAAKTESTRTSPTQLVVPISICKMQRPRGESLPEQARNRGGGASSGSRCGRRAGRAGRSGRARRCPAPDGGAHRRSGEPEPRKGAHPEDEQGPSTMLQALASHRERMAMVASPAPRRRH